MITYIDIIIMGNVWLIQITHHFSSFVHKYFCICVLLAKHQTILQYFFLSFFTFCIFNPFLLTEKKSKHYDLAVKTTFIIQLALVLVTDNNIPVITESLIDFQKLKHTLLLALNKALQSTPQEKKCLFQICRNMHFWVWHVVHVDDKF